MQQPSSISTFTQDPIFVDSDGDSLDDLREMIEGTDPYVADTDGDGVPDGTEVQAGTDPLDANDFAAPPPEQLAEVQLTVGDHSGSYSERWILHVGARNFQGPNSIENI